MDNVSAKLNQAVGAIKKKDYARAREILKAVIKSDPNTVEAWLLYARVAPDTEQARQALEWALKLDPTSPLGLKMMGQLEEAQEQASQSRPTQPRPASPDLREEPNPLEAGRSDDLQERTDDAKSQAQRRNSGDESRLPEKQAKRAGGSINFTWVAIIIIICLLSVGAFLLLQDSTDIGGLFEAAPTPTSDELFAVIYRNIQAANAEDVTAYMDTIHSNSPLYDQTENALRMAISTYDLSYSTSNLSVEELSRKEARVHFFLTTRKISGPAFRDNTIEGVFVLRPEDGVWKIYQQETLEVTFLN